jgi:hypothetical protein
MDQDVLDETMFFGIYRDDGLAVFPRVRMQADVEHWLSTFQGAINNKVQGAINNKAGNDKLSFMAEVWTTGEEGTMMVREKVGTEAADRFPFLDMELSWDKEGSYLEIQSTHETEPTTEYLNTGSTHTPGCFKAIMTGVCYRLTKLTTVDENNEDIKLEESYTEHFGALNKADLLKNFEVPTLGAKAAALEVASKDEVKEATKKRRERDRK